MALATCAECDEEIEVNERVRIGQRVVCSNCGARLEVVSTSPLELDPGYEDEEEWDDDDDLDDLEDEEFDDDWDDDELDDFDDDLDDEDEKW